MSGVAGVYSPSVAPLCTFFAGGVRMDYTDKTRFEELHRKLADRINNKTGFSTHNGIRILKVGVHHCAGELSIGQKTQNSLGMVHGGALFSLADTVAGVAVCSGGVSAVTVSSSFDFLRAPKGTVVRCEAESMKVGSKIAVFRCVITDEAGELVAVGQFSFLILSRLPGFEVQR